ncbi:hypothetical protein [Companilactobacillus musae]|uniref:hypothetical protein n=1 Tax=Companilactobacillus musae TaxID=1903258 RepID=UPI000E650A09|nr:hypothetical protein [Companilactobacillus musae]
MSNLIALVILIFGCGEIYVTIKAFINMKKENKKFPKFSRFALLYGSLFGAILIFSGFDILFKWI